MRLFVKKNIDNYVNDEGSSLTIVNEGLSLTIVKETTNFLKTVVFEKKKLHATLLNVVLHEVKKCEGAGTS